MNDNTPKKYLYTITFSITDERTKERVGFTHQVKGEHASVFFSPTNPGTRKYWEKFQEGTSVLADQMGR